MFCFSFTESLAATVLPQMSKDCNLPIIDISGETHRHVIIAQGSAKIYHGHPDTLLLADGKTMFCAWTIDHGGHCGPMKKSSDSGLTWESVKTPENWKTVFNCPTIHSIVDSNGMERLFVFAGYGDMQQAYSLDRGRSWTPMKKNGLKDIVVPLNVLPVEGSKKHLMWYHRGKDDIDKSQLSVWQSASIDGGLTWSDTRKICEVKDAAACEPAVIRSPDGKELLMLMRDNLKTYNALMMTSADEGRTWSKPRDVPAGLCGDRHNMRYVPDDRMIVCFRDLAENSPTRGSFIAWVGTYDDIINRREGQYRIKLLHQYVTAGVFPEDQTWWRSFDCGYPGLEVLGDGTIVATTYVKYRPGPEMNSIVSVRFKLDDIDQKVQKSK